MFSRRVGIEMATFGFPAEGAPMLSIYFNRAIPRDQHERVSAAVEAYLAESGIDVRCEVNMIGTGFFMFGAFPNPKLAYKTALLALSRCHIIEEKTYNEAPELRTLGPGHGIT